MKNKFKNIIKISLLLIITLFSFSFSINNSSAYDDRYTECYNEFIEADETAIRNEDWYNKVYTECNSRGQVSTSTYTFLNGDEVKIIDIRKNNADGIKNDFDGFSTFEAYLNNARDAYTNIYTDHLIYQACIKSGKDESYCKENSEVSISDNANVIGAGITCFNSYSVKLTKVGTPANSCLNKKDTKSPNLSADKSSEEWKRAIGKITLSVSDDAYSTGIKYSKYSWISATDCLSNDNLKEFEDGDKIQVPGNGVNKLYLCAADNENPTKDKDGNACSPSHTKTWEGTYKLDNPKNCLENTLPTNTGGMDIIDKGIVSEIYNYNDPVCGYTCEDGYEINFHGTETTSDDTCDLIVQCNEDTLPSNTTIKNNNPSTANESFTYNSNTCGYVCDTGYDYDTTTKECKVITNPSCNDTTLPDNSTITASNPTSENEEYDYNSNTCGFTCNTEKGYEYNSTTETCEKIICTEPSTKPNDLSLFNYNSLNCEYTCKSGTLNQHGTPYDLSNDTCDTSSCAKPTSTPDLALFNYNSGSCTYTCKEGTKNDNGTAEDLTDDTCNSTGGKYCSSTEKPTNTDNMTFVGIDKATSTNQKFVAGSESCGYVCDTNYKLNNHGNSDPKDDTCEYDTNKCTSGIITDNCPCTLNINSNTSACVPETEPGQIGIMNKNLLADTYSYRISSPVGPNDSAIDYINVQYEKANGSSGYETLRYPDYKFSWDMTDVDSDRKNPEGYREYSLIVLEICDKAGWCTEPKTKYTHNVYANTTSFGTQNTNYETSGVADGTSKYTNITLKGKYGNEVVSASGINRTIDFNFDVNNTVNQDQYTNSRNAVFMSEANNSDYANRIALGNHLNQLKNQKSSDGEYKFGFKFYAPTNDDNEFKLNKLSVDINGELGNIQNYSLATDKDYEFTPLYITEFTGEQSIGLKSITTQTGSLILEKDSSSTKPISGINSKDNTILQIGGNSSNSFNFTHTINPSNLFTSLFTFVDNGNNYLDDFKTVYIQSGIKYVNDGKNIKYKSTKIGGDNDTVRGVKIQGRTNINSDRQRDITENQDVNDVHNINGRIDKASLKKYIKRNAFKLTKGMNSGMELNGIKYYDLSNTSSPKELSFNYNGTIIIKGGNAYIKNNIKIGGLIVLKNSNGNGGKLYIDPNVSKIEAAIYVDKSILSYDGTNELSSNTNYSVLKNQLYIYGSVFSENTIGGSLKNPPVCPYYVNSCTQEEAQKYDLNFLRSGYNNKSDSSLGDYPVIIKYNSGIQTNTPKGFGN